MTRPIDITLRELVQPAAPPAAESVPIADLSKPTILAAHRMKFAAAAAVLFTASLAIGIWSGYRLVPSLVVAFAVIYAAYFLYLNGIVYAHEICASRRRDQSH
jgi:hypothetical protein